MFTKPSTGPYSGILDCKKSKLPILWSGIAYSFTITGAMRAAQIAAIEDLLGLSPLHLQVEAETKVGNYRLRCSDQWKPKSEGFEHAYMTQDTKKEPSYRWGLTNDTETCL
jgi:hypothetical protein